MTDLKTVPVTVVCTHSCMTSTQWVACGVLKLAARQRSDARNVCQDVLHGTPAEGCIIGDVDIAGVGLAGRVEGVG